MTSTFTATADETTAQVIDTVTKVQNATLEAVSTFANNVPDVTKFVESLPKNPSFKIDRPALKRLFEDVATTAA